jgi:hypothetical protein
VAQRVTRSQELAHFQITVDNKDYHHLSRFEIAGGKRISQHLFRLGRFLRLKF